MRSPGSHHEGPQRQAALSQQSLSYHTVGLSYGLEKKKIREKKRPSFHPLQKTLPD